MKQAKRKPTAGSRPSAGPRIIAALTELAESLERGESLPPGATARQVDVPDEPGTYDAPAVRAARERLGATREGFAGMLGVSPAMAQSLELGRRAPSRRVRRMLDEFAREPGRWRGLADARAARAKAEALAALEELRGKLAALAERENNRRAIDVRLDELRDTIDGLGRTRGT